MHRYRISPDDEVGRAVLETTRRGMDVSSSEVLPYETKSGSRYLHVTCKPCNDQPDRRSQRQEVVSMAELD